MKKNINLVEITVVEVYAVTTKRYYVKFKPIMTKRRGYFGVDFK